MVTELEPDEISLRLDELAEALLDEAGCPAPPIDALLVAQRLGLQVAIDARQSGRARIARLATPSGAGRGSILVRPEPRVERLQWAIAHEIGESSAGRAFAQLDLDPRSESPGLRERIANQLAGRLLAPTRSFAVDVARTGGDLLALKRRYATASHELLARRMLDLPTPAVLTIFDNGRISLRLANAGSRRPPIADVERACQGLAEQTGEPARLAAPPLHAVCWPIHEPHWRREILRTTWDVDG